MISSASIAACTLIRMLVLFINARKSLSVTPLYVAGKDNKMAYMVSSSFKEGKYFSAFNNIITYFNHHFPLPENYPWLECHIPTKSVSRVIECLYGKQL